MTQNLLFIKKELKNCEEIESPYDLIQNQVVKYITLKDEQEYFYTGGMYQRMGDNKIFIKNDKGSTKHVTLVYPDKLGNLLYRTRLFVESNPLSTNQTENEKIIRNQQMIIEKMNLQLKKQNDIIRQLHQKLTSKEK